MAFWGLPLKPGEKKSAELAGGEILHVSQVCLHEPKPGKNYLQIEVKGTTFTVACLEKDKREHDALDLMFSPEDKPKFHAKGGSDIHLVGYMEPDEVDAEEPEGVAAGKTTSVQAKASPAAKATPSPKMLAAAKASPKAAPKPSPKLAAQATTSSPKLTAKEAAPKAEAKAAAKTEAEGEDEDEEGEEEEGGEKDEEVEIEGEGEEGEEEEPRVKDPIVDADKEKKAKASSKKGEAAGAAVKAQPESKRKAPAEAAGAPAGKKAKDDAGKKKSKDDTEPLKPEEGDYVQKLVGYLKANGKTTVSLLGSKVPRPKSLPKLKDIINKHTGKFKIVGDSVEAK